MLYRYRGTDPNHRDNLGLRELIRRGLPLVYLHGIVPGKYLAIWPVFVIDDDRNGLTFKVVVDDQLAIEKYVDKGSEPKFADTADMGKRIYLTTVVRQRLHQRGFRERVLYAYHSQCALCRLKHQELLDAAHIIPDKEAMGEPKITNGIALCLSLIHI